MILTPDQRLRVFVSSTLGELARERAVVRQAIETMRMAPVMFEMGARPHPPRVLYRAYLDQSHVFLAIYAERYGWVAPEMDISGLEDEFRLSGDRPKLVYVKEPAPGREQRLAAMLEDVAADPHVLLRTFSSDDELASRVADDLAELLAAPFADRPPDPAHTVPVPLSTVPVPTSSLVGREHEVTAVTELVRRPDVRLVTITGMGGIGKSRVALEVAQVVEPDFPGGVVFVPLATVPEPGLVITTIATRLGVRLDTSRPSLDAVVESLAERGRTLLVLDNAEHVRDAADDLASLVALCAELTVLVTSRTRARLVAEYDYPLDPLPTGASTTEAGFGVTDASEETLYQRAKGSAAVRLFLERAAEARPSYDITADESQLRAVVELCRRLEGLPLAIEIAAARVRLLTPTQLLERLDRRIDLPPSRLADLPERQRTLRSTMEWSYELLGPAERGVLRQLSTFVGGASLTAIEEVARCDDDLLESLATLADHSLLGVDASVVDAPRFTMLETVRDYAREQLESSGAAADVDARHLAWVRGMAERASVELRGPGHAEWLERLELESANIRVAGTRANAAGDPESLVHVGYSVWLWLWARHHTREARLWFERALDLEQQLTPLARARLAWVLAGAAVEQGDNETAESRLAEATALFTEVGDGEGLALCGFLEASLAPIHGELARSQEIFTRLESEFLEHGNYFAASICASTAGTMAAQQGRISEAEALLDLGLEHAGRIDNAMLRSQALVARGFARIGRGAVAEATEDLLRGAEHAQESFNPEFLSFACDGLAAVALASGAVDDRTASLVGAAHGLRERAGIVPWPVLRPVMVAIADGVRGSLPADRWESAYARGRHLAAPDVLGLARAVAAPVTSAASVSVAEQRRPLETDVRATEPATGTD